MNHSSNENNASRPNQSGKNAAVATPARSEVSKNMPGSKRTSTHPTTPVAQGAKTMRPNTPSRPQGNQNATQPMELEPTQVDDRQPPSKRTRYDFYGEDGTTQGPQAPRTPKRTPHRRMSQPMSVRTASPDGCYDPDDPSMLKFNKSEQLVPALLSPGGFQRLFKGLTNIDIAADWKVDTRKSTKFYFRAMSEDSWVYCGKKYNDLKMLSKVLKDEHLKDQRQAIYIEIRTRKIDRDISFEDKPFSKFKGTIEGSIIDQLEESESNWADPKRCIAVPNDVTDEWMRITLFPFVELESERLFANQVPQWSKQKRERLVKLQEEIYRLENIERSPRDMSHLARMMGISMTRGVCILLEGSLRKDFTGAHARKFSSEILDFSQTFANCHDNTDLLPDPRFRTWENYARFFEDNESMSTIMNSGELLHGGAAYVRCMKECESAVRFCQPQLPKSEELLQHLREKLLQGGGISSQMTWRRLVDKILDGAAKSVIRNSVLYCSCRLRWFLMQYKSHVVSWMATLKGSPEEFSYPAKYVSHGQILRERQDIVQAVFDAYDVAISNLAVTFENSFRDMLTALFADIQGFLRRLEKPWEISAKKAPKPKEEGEETKLFLKPIESETSIYCDPKTADKDGMVMTVGRSPENKYIIEDPRVSGNHFAIKYKNGAWTVMDCSTNGTWLNGDKIGKPNENPLRHGDAVNILNPSTFGNSRPAGIVYQVIFVGKNASQDKSENVARVIREMRRENYGAVEQHEVFDPILLEERLPMVATLVSDGFKAVRSWVAEQIPLFTEAFFTRPLECKLWDEMSNIWIEKPPVLPELETRLRKLKQDEAETIRSIEELMDRRQNFLMNVQ